MSSWVRLTSDLQFLDLNLGLYLELSKITKEF